jgi:EmrB/QacA subfamily drug resistance transporter
MKDSTKKGAIEDHQDLKLGALVVLCLTFFLIALDNTIVVVAIPTFSRTLGASTSALQWITDAYTTTFAALIIVGGYIADRQGRRPILTVALTVFILGSLIATVANSVGLVIAGRAVMGAGAALAIPSSLSMLVDVFPSGGPRKTAIAGWTASAGLGVAVGPLVGGVLLDHFWWGSIFLASAAVALIVLFAAIVFLPSSTPRHTGRFDFLGSLLSLGALLALVSAIIEAPSWGWTSIRIVALASLAIVLAGILVMRERRSQTGVLRLDIISVPTFSVPSLAMGIVYFVIFGYLFLATQYLQEILSESALNAGLHLLPAAAAVVVGSGIARAVTTRLPARYIYALGLAALTIAGFIMHELTPTSGYINIALTLVAGGLAMGLVLTRGTESVMSTLTTDETGIGAGINVSIMEIGGAFGVAVFGTLFNDSFRSYGHQHLASLNPGTLSTATRSLASALEMISRFATAHGAARLLLDVHQAFVDGFTTAAYAGITLCLAGIVAVLTSLRSSRTKAISEL